MCSTRIHKVTLDQLLYGNDNLSLEANLAIDTAVVYFVKNNKGMNSNELNIITEYIFQ